MGSQRHCREQRLGVGLKLVALTMLLFTTVPCTSFSIGGRRGALRPAPLQRRAAAVVAVPPPPEGVQPQAEVEASRGMGPKPLWRGELHRIGALVYPVVGPATLCFAASSSRALAHSLLFSAALEGILVVSAILHTRDWTGREKALERWRLADYSMIFIGIGLFYMSLGAQLMGGTRIFNLLIAPLVWTAAAVGVGGKILALNQPRWVEALAFLSQGYAWVLGYGVVKARLTPWEWSTLMGGGICICAGVLAYVLQWPSYDWHRRRFQAHEAFHLGTIGMFGFFFLTMLSLVGRG